MPTSWPATANRWCPSASISATRSLARVPVSYPSSGLPDRPIPRWSGATTEKSRASAGITSRQAYQVWGQPWTSSSGGPWPPVTTCWRRPPVSMYWLVNVPAKPSGRLGAPETEPGPSGTGRLAADELMRIPFASTHGRLPRPYAVEVPAEMPAGMTREAALAESGTAPAVAGYHHFAPTVSDVEASAQWYERVFGMTRVPVAFPHHGEEQGGYAVVLMEPRSGIVLGLHHHDANPGRPFDEKSTGLDHMSFAV